MDVLEGRQLTKHFGGVKAIDEVDINIEAGEIHALVGANGAGKSTLMKLLAGVFNHYEGDVTLNGDKIHLTRPEIAFRYGINCIHQEVDTVLMPDLTVKENLLIYDYVLGKKNSWINRTKLRDKSREILSNTVEVDIDPDEYVKNLKVHQKQVIIIARAIHFGGKFLFFDEPTTSLDLTETEQLLKLIRQLNRKMKGIIYVSHRLKEIMNLADRITVLCDGKRVFSEDMRNVSEKDVIKGMMGGKGKLVQIEAPSFEETKKKTILKVNNLTKDKMVDSVSFELKEGEILGVFGQVGAGKTELAQLLYGVEKHETGEFLLNGTEVHFNHPLDAIRNGIFMITEDRRSKGLLMNDSIKLNMSLPTIHHYLNRFRFINKKKEENKVLEMVERLEIKLSSITEPVFTLSGGNQQKVVIAKWLLYPGKKIFIFDEPTKGIDIGVKAKIHNMVRDMAEEGIAVIYVSNEIEEILALSHRIIVMCDGKVKLNVENKGVEEEELMACSLGF